MSSIEEDGPFQYEVQCSHYGDLTPSLNWVIGCSSDHSKFVLVKDFNLADLPEEIRCMEVVKLINLNIDLAVMVSVKSVRDAVAETNNEGTDKQGSGSICYFSNTHDLFPCNHGDVDKCQLCHISNCPYLVTLGEGHFMVTNSRSSLSEDELARAHLAFRVSTNQHVVRDLEDAKNTNVQLFYHDKDKKDTLTASVVCLCEKWEEQDKVHLVCVMDMNNQVRSLLTSMCCDMRQLFASIPSSVREKFISSYVVVVSHPHGTQKVVSVGKKIKCEHKSSTNGSWYMETRYQVETCLGCSGAPVIGPGWADGGPGYRVHCGFVTLSKSKQKLCVSKSHWVVDSDVRGGILPGVNQTG